MIMVMVMMIMMMIMLMMMMMMMMMIMMMMKMIINICFDCHDTLFRFIIDSVGYRIFLHCLFDLH